MSGFIGRGELLESVKGLVDGGARLVTLLGPPGVGKSRVLKEFAHARETSVLDLSAIVDESGFRELLAHASADGPLLVLDHVERCAFFLAPVVLELLTDRARSIVVASRELLRISDEVPLAVRPLSVPGSEVATLEEVRSSEAGRLLLQRAHAASFSEFDAQAIAELLQRLDGIPLAVELAASRLRVMSPGELLSKLEHSIDVLGGGARDHRHSSLRAAVEDAMGALDETLQDVLGQCAVFRQRFALEAAERVLKIPEGHGLIDALQDLVDRSLLFAERDADTAMRFGMLDPIRTIAFGQLDPVDREDLVLRHALHYAKRGFDLASHKTNDFVPKLDVDLDNLVGAVQSMLDEGALAAEHLQMVKTGAMRLSDQLKGRLKIGAFALAVDNFEQVTTVAPENVSGERKVELRARVHCFLATALAARGRPARARRMFMQTQKEAEVVAPLVAARAAIALGALAASSARFEQAADHFASAGRSLTIADDPEAARLQFLCSTLVGNGYLFAGRPNDAHDQFEALLVQLPEASTDSDGPLLLGNLATACRDGGDLGEALRHLETAKAILERQLGESKADDAESARLLLASVSARMGAVQHEVAGEESPLALYDAAIRAFRQANATRAEAVVASWRSMYLSMHASPPAARQAYDEAATAGRAIGDAGTLQSVRNAEAMLAIAEAREALSSSKPDDAARLRLKAERLASQAEADPPVPTYSTADQADDHRFERALIQRALAEDMLMLSREGKCFRLPGASAAVEITQPRISRLLSILVARHEESPGVGLHAEALVQRMWPDEKMDFSSGQNRLQVSLSSLRALGLKELIVRRNGLYALDCAQPIVTVE